MRISDAVVLIPSLNPDEKLPRLIRGLREEGFEWILVVDDGSGPEYASIFEKVKELDCLLVRHERNLGKGAAIKTALESAVKECGRTAWYITADSDGQHRPKDIRCVADVMEMYPDSLVLGIRNLKSQDVPLRSLVGNRVTSLLFRLVSGISCPDTQTGLRGIPPNLLDLALSEEGSRYEYEMNFLMDAVLCAPVKYVPVGTVYEDGNRASHFRPVADSCRVYGRFLRFAAASLAGFVLDYALFCGFTSWLAFSQAGVIFAATGGLL